MARLTRRPRLVVSNTTGTDVIVRPAKFKASLDVLPTASPLRWHSTSILPQREWLYGRELIRKFLTVTVAAGGSGKTLLAIVEALAMASGRNLLGCEPVGQLRVWLYNGEDPLDEMERRVLAAAKYYGITEDEVQDRLFLDSGRNRPLVVMQQLREGLTIHKPMMGGLAAAIKSRKIDVLIVDPFVSFHQVTENDNVGIDRVAKLWGKLADYTGCAVLLVHHARKTFGNEVTIDDARGASALMAAARIGRVINPMTREEATKAGLPGPRSHFRVTNGKSSLSKPADAHTWFEIRSVDLYNGPDGAPGDSVGVVTPWAWTTAGGSVEPSEILAVHEAMAGSEWRRSSQAPSWVGIAVAKALGLNLPADAKKVEATIKTMLAEGHLATSEGLDSKRMKRTFVVPATPSKT